MGRVLYRGKNKHFLRLHTCELEAYSIPDNVRVDPCKVALHPVYQTSEHTCGGCPDLDYPLDFRVNFEELISPSTVDHVPTGVFTQLVPAGGGTWEYEWQFVGVNPSEIIKPDHFKLGRRIVTPPPSFGPGQATISYQHCNSTKHMGKIWYIRNSGPVAEAIEVYSGPFKFGAPIHFGGYPFPALSALPEGVTVPELTPEFTPYGVMYTWWLGYVGTKVQIQLRASEFGSGFDRFGSRPVLQYGRQRWLPDGGGAPHEWSVVLPRLHDNPASIWNDSFAPGQTAPHMPADPLSIALMWEWSISGADRCNVYERMLRGELTMTLDQVLVSTTPVHTSGRLYNPTNNLDVPSQLTMTFDGSYVTGPT